MEGWDANRLGSHTEDGRKLGSTFAGGPVTDTVQGQAGVAGRLALIIMC